MNGPSASTCCMMDDTPPGNREREPVRMERRRSNYMVVEKRRSNFYGSGREAVQGDRQHCYRLGFGGGLGREGFGKGLAA